MKIKYFNSIYFYICISILMHGIVFTAPGLFRYKNINQFKKQILLQAKDIILKEYDEISDRINIYDKNISKGELFNIQESLITYREVLRAEIYKNLEYPEIARRKEIQGEAMVNFTINRDGRILKYKITKSTGFYILDNAVKKVFKKIDGFPEVPDFFQKEILEFNLPVGFNLKELN